MIDLRSDTVTRPTPAMRRAMVPDATMNHTRRGGRRTAGTEPIHHDRHSSTRVNRQAYEESVDASAIPSEVVVDGFNQMPFLVAGTRRVALLQERLARLLAPVAGVRLLDCPFEVVPLAEAFWWNPMYRNDPAHMWLRDLLVAAAADLRL